MPFPETESHSLSLSTENLMADDKADSDISQLCYVVGQLSGKVDLLVDKITETMTSLVTERTRIDGIDRRLAAFSVIGPILAVVVPSAISVFLALMMRPPVDRGLTGAEVLRLREGLQLLDKLDKARPKPGGNHFRGEG